jgi:hypothetical protein
VGAASDWVSYEARLSWETAFSRSAILKATVFLSRSLCSWRADWRSATMASNSSALWGSRALLQSSRILSSSRRFSTLTPPLILPTDRRYVRYRTYCIFEEERGVRNNLICFDRLKLICLLPRPRMDSRRNRDAQRFLYNRRWGKHSKVMIRFPEKTTADKPK